MQSTELPQFCTARDVHHMWFSPRRFMRGGYDEREVEEAFEIVEYTLIAYEEFMERISIAVIDTDDEKLRLLVNAALRRLERRRRFPEKRRI